MENSVGNNENEISLIKVLKNKHYMESFMKHLSKEFSLEIITSYIEFTQFQQHLINICKDNNSELIIENVTLIEFYNEIPISEIVNATSSDEYFKEYINIYDIKDWKILNKLKGYKLYKKYISNESEYEINISGNEKLNLYNLINNLDKFISFNTTNKEMFYLFQNSKNELIKLIQNSFHRFKYTNDFKNLTQTVNSV